MIRRSLALMVLVLLAGCTWSNSLYHARRLSRAAEKLEREGRPFDAGTAWGEAVTKADSAYARHPGGKAGAEALWLRGRALARLNDCEQAAPALERAWLEAPEAEWRDALLLDLGRCRDRIGDPRALAALLPLLESPDPAVRLEAKARAGRAYVTARAWDDALRALDGVEGNAARVDRSIALAALGRTDDALAEVEPLLVRADTSVAWARLLGSIAQRDAPDAEALLGRLRAFPQLAPRHTAAWDSAMARGAAIPRADIPTYLQRAARTIGNPASSDARIRLAEWRLAAARTPQQLDSLLAGIESLTASDLAAGLVIGRYERLGRALLADIDSVPSGGPLGDLAYFHQAEIARDSLRAPLLASWLLAHLASDWPDSPFVPKATLARIALEPDSGMVLRERVRAHPENPYLAYLRGEAGAGFRQLEDSLSQYIGDRAAIAATRPRAPAPISEFE